MRPTDAQVEAAYKALDWDMKKKEACQLIRKVWRAMNDAAAVPNEAPQAEAWGQEPSAFMVRRDYMGGGYTEWLCKTRGDAEEMAKDAASLPNPDKIIPLYRAGQGRDAAREALIALDERLRECLGHPEITAGEAYDSFYQEMVVAALAAIEPCKT